ncbi:WD-REPEATS-REGION domain-containing protein [Mycena chlorophos]|uniref:WD-REPEATS-REGION domain-containing protein n=1 Tax=Mycena chlorophos TaxID=658473 RepID=A0A8H6SQG3_MYCCL|nr:WD-REPEATS-REGION domain-containing protein [Mycena chlorophos]
MSTPVWRLDEPEEADAGSSADARQRAQMAAFRAIFGPLLQRQGGGAINLNSLNMAQLSQLLAGTSAAAGSAAGGNDDEEEEEEDDDDEADYHQSIRQSSHRNYFPEVKAPQEAGLKLLYSGDFGRVGPKIHARERNHNIARTLRARASTGRPRFSREEYMTGLVPNSSGTTVAEFGANVYSAQYSADSSFFYTCSQDFQLNIFDANVPVQPRVPGRRYNDPNPYLKTNMVVKNSITAHSGRWTITDANLSPDNERMVYAIMSSTCYMTSTTDAAPSQIPIPFSDPPGTTRQRSTSLWGFDSGYRIYSTRFSADGQEIIAGGSGQIFVYDLLANRRAVKIEAHNDDVNSCTWADTASGNVLVSASDDTYLKVWDRRSLGASQRPSGVLMGHTEGITYVSAKGDGRYVISNGKDQKLRLWDLRKMRTNAEFEEEKDKFYGTNFDYRSAHYPRPRFAAHPKDCSVMSYHGHSVMRTLIRCHFSPAETTGGQYIYSGSADGRVHIWSLDGRVVQVLDRARTFPMSFDPSGEEPERRNSRDWDACVRDVSWHSQEPVLMSAAWEGMRGNSRVARHEWKGLAKMGGSLEDWTERQRANASESSGTRRSSRLSGSARVPGGRMPGTFSESELEEGMMEEDEDDEDDEDWEP